MLFLPFALAVPALTNDDQGRAREVVERSAVLSLADILRIVKDRFGGRVIEVEIEEDDGRDRYELELVARNGRLMEIGGTRSQLG